MNNSLPASKTMVSPPGKIQAPKNLPTEANGTDTATAVEATPPKPIKAPAMMPSKSILATGVLTFAFPVAI